MLVSPERRQVYGAALVGEGGFDIRQQRRAGFGRARLRLLQRFARKLDVGVAFGRSGDLHGALQAQWQGWADALIGRQGRTGQAYRQHRQAKESHSFTSLWSVCGSGARNPPLRNAIRRAIRSRNGVTAPTRRAWSPALRTWCGPWRRS